jgi:hypothetical protein
VITHVIGFDDAPFARAHRGDVPIVGAVFAGLRLEGIVMGRVRRDGRNATAAIARLSRGSRFGAHLQAVLLQGIAMAGFNVVDIGELATLVRAPVIVIARQAPNLRAIEHALRTRVRGGLRKWELIQRAHEMEPAGAVWMQRAGIEAEPARTLVARLAVSGNIPEPLRVAHLFAGALAMGSSRGRV